MVLQTSMPQESAKPASSPTNLPVHSKASKHAWPAWLHGSKVQACNICRPDTQSDPDLDVGTLRNRTVPSKDENIATHEKYEDEFKLFANLW